MGEDDVCSALKAIVGEATDQTKWKVSNIGLELKGALKQMASPIEIERHVAILRIRNKPKCNDSEALQNVLTCRAVLHNLVADAYSSLHCTADSVVAFDADIALDEPE